MNPHFFHKKIIRKSVKSISASFILFIVSLSPVAAGILIMRGTNVRINSSTFITAFQDVTLENGSSLTVEGSLVLKSDFSNKNTLANLGNGSLEFSGTSCQKMVGQNILGRLVINNSIGLNLIGNTTVNQELCLLNGSIRIGTSCLTLGNGSIVSGVPSVSAMVVATETGELRKSFSGTGIFTFPVGDEFGEYTPVTLNFTSGSFAPGNYVGVTLKSAALSGYSGKSLNRIWMLTNKGISDYHYDAAFQYVPEDNTGNENGLLCVKVGPQALEFFNPSNTRLHQLTAIGLNSFGVFTGINSQLHTDIPLHMENAGFKSYPNPFTKKITIEVQNSKEDNMNVVIYNLSGQCIKHLFKEQKNENMNLIWDATNESGQHVSPGIYIIKVNGQSNQVIYEGAIK